MTIYLDSAIISEAERAEKFGWVSGVTTNPIQSCFSPHS